VGSEPEEPLIGDEPAGPVAARTSGAEAAGTAEAVDVPAPGAAGVAGTLPDRLGAEAQPVALASMPVGVEVGTLVHRVLEVTDFAAADLSAELTQRLHEVQARRAVEIGNPGAVVEGLAAALQTPLGDVFDDQPLSRIAHADRLCELTFELPLAGGANPRGTLSLAHIAAALRARLSPGDPLVAYADRLADAALRQSVRGYLTGSLDLVVRLHGADGPRFAVIDYKTNWLGTPDEPLTAYHYRPAAIVAEMQRHHYVLQALLYLVALYRYLRWRLPDGDPEARIAGVGYLFLRGMTGAAAAGANGTPPGVFAWRPPPGLVAELSAALDAREEAA
jgi:exodeoxyribonuclease V beta subunit